MDVTLCQELLAAGKHAQLADLLSDLKAQSEAAGEPARSVTIAAAIAACETCGELRREVERCHRDAHAASEREVSLQRSLEPLLETLIGHPGASSLPTCVTVVGAAETTSRPAPESSPVSARQRSIVVFALGPTETYLDGELLTDLGGAKAQAVLRYLLLRRREHVPNEVLMEVLWPGVNPEAARRNLHQAVYSLRRALHRRRARRADVCFQGDCYFFNPALDLWLDFEQFERHVDLGDRQAAHGGPDAAERDYAAAASLYRGELFGDRPYEEWIAPERERLRALHRRAVEWLSDRAQARGEHLTVVALLQQVLGQDPLDEAVHRRLMRAYAAQGQRGLAARQYQVCRQTLARRLGLEPSSATKDIGRELGLGRGGR